MLKGINLGGWLMMEAYFLHAPNLPEKKFRAEFKAALGEKALFDFDQNFRRNFIQKKDIELIAQWGFNCIRLPFHYRVIDSAVHKKDPRGLVLLDQAIQWCKEAGLWVILDFHAAVGSQNCDWHSDSSGEANLWTSAKNQERTIALWEALAARYKDEATVAGFDLLNEAVLSDPGPLNRYYKKLIQAIRRIDKRHILFVEGNNWAMDMACLDEFDDDNLALSLHHYLPLELTFNFVPHLRYPLQSRKGRWDKPAMKKYLARFQAISRKCQRPILVGEFGINYRANLFNELDWLKDTLDCFNQYGFHWLYWTYKAIKNSCFPDGIFSYYHNPPWVHREGPLMGWDTYAQHWKKHKKEMILSWQTREFQLNQDLLKVLRNGI